MKKSFKNSELNVKKSSKIGLPKYKKKKENKRYRCKKLRKSWCKAKKNKNNLKGR